jgi:hypothetical protein
MQPPTLVRWIDGRKIFRAAIAVVSEARKRIRRRKGFSVYYYVCSTTIINKHRLVIIIVAQKIYLR